MTLKAKERHPDVQQVVVHRTVRAVAFHAVFGKAGSMFVGKRAFLFRMALCAGIFFRKSLQLLVID